MFYDIIWILSLFEAVPPFPLYTAVRKIHPNLSDDVIRDKLYVLKTCGWVKSFSFAGRDYYFLPDNRDPYVYSFIHDRRPRDVPAEKLALASAYREGADVNKSVMKRLQQVRGGGV